MQAFSPAAAPDWMELVTVPEVTGLEVLRVDAAARTWRWYHDAYTISIASVPMMVEWRYRGRTHRTTPGCIGLFEPGELHTELRKLHPRDLLRVALLSPAMMRATAHEVGVPADRVHWRDAQVNDPELLRRIAALHAGLEREASLLERQVRAADLLEHLLTGFVEQRTPPVTGAEPAAMRRARAVLRDRLADNVSLDDLAAESGIGRFHLVRSFRATFGLPPHAYQMQMRLTRAMTLIRTGLPLAQVALDTGFTDQSHLTKRFTRAVGLSPGRYRHAVR